MYSPSGYAAQSIDAIVGYVPATSSFSLSETVEQAYSCEGCRKILGRMYGKADIPVAHSAAAYSAGKGSYGKNSYANAGDYNSTNSGVISYNENPTTGSSYQNVSRTYEFSPSIFLKPVRPETEFVDNEGQIIELANETFLHLTGQQLPKGISISICTKEELRQRHGGFGQWSDGIQGFAINSSPLKRVFVKHDHLDMVMMVLGHELGHVFTPSLPNKHDEEAKAFSFAEAWALCIKKHDIGGLAASIKEENEWQPARNGLHDVAFLFVRSLLGKGLQPMQVHWDLVKGYRSLFNNYF